MWSWWRLQDTWLSPAASEFFAEATPEALAPYRDLVSAADELTVSNHALADSQRVPDDSGRYGDGRSGGGGAAGAPGGAAGGAGGGGRRAGGGGHRGVHASARGVTWAGTRLDRQGRAGCRYSRTRGTWCSARSGEYWAGGATGSEPNRATVLDPITAAGLWEFVEGEAALTAEVVMVPTPGHTPGHVSLLVSSGGESALLIGDAAHSPIQVSEPEWCIGADVDRPLARRTRAALWARAEREGLLLGTNHFPFPGLGRVVSEDGVRRWEEVGAPLGLLRFEELDMVARQGRGFPPKGRRRSRSCSGGRGRRRRQPR